MIEALGVWGTRRIGQIGNEDLNPKLLLDLPRNFVRDAVPANTRNWWLVITPDDTDVCDVDPGYAVNRHGDRRPARHDRGVAR
ncbi:hypothetical protein [Streptomyces sp. SP17KL33]|uniref:hypothetical protein n=1 Tax=Streptomyces sp. SP17KL33 TaxID=3002534 RepID=UPI002E78D8F8|nr:hypothetical protein [Streptomyces sp. SP17KL33]MEE1831821.1 hypothetical protein [Streptomyces sp. SP17KL33]